MAPQGSVSVDGMKIDLAQVPAAIQLYRETRDRMNDLAGRAGADLQIEPMGNDDVSRDVAHEFNTRNLQSTGSVAAAITAFRDRLNTIIDQLTAVQQQYRLTDDSNKTKF
ncbi:hypothetical protein M8C13_35095 [Crossiella sp. SN42]|uniref:hypothetical protein n=1 Tax=Crossiella sp. SN42 TaxID=2944808 RepID=UPI00207C3D5F|nr:hypothetical protein [Crossiella sp. SN42]MCO1580992.1 hypothetical protein [Crossiella sp. SN42]